MEQKSSSFILLIPFVFLSSCVSSGVTPTTIQDDLLSCLVSYNSNSSVAPISEAFYPPNNSSFLSVLESYERNLRFLPDQSPQVVAIVTALDVSHVQATVKCGRKLNLLIKTRSGGHDYEGLSCRSNLPFVILDMFNLRSIDINLEDDTMWVESGAILGEIYYNIAKNSNVRAFPAGIGTTVGVGGHFSGGGYGNLMRKYGLTIDNVIDAHLVNADGEVLDRKAMGEDLFWAIRGGGGASFGVILSWKVQLVAVPEKVTYFHVNRTLEEGASDLVYQWQQVATTLPEELYIRLETRVVNRTVNVAFITLFLGEADQLLEIMESNFPTLGLQKSDCKEMPWVNTTLFWAEFPFGIPLEALVTRKFKGGVAFKFKSDYLREVIPKEGLETIWRNMIDTHQKVKIQWNPYGGRMAQIGVSETPYPHRDALAKIEYVYIWTGEEGEDVTESYLASSRIFYEFMTPYVTKNPREAFLNYRDLDIGSSPYCNATYEEAEVYGRKYFKGNFERLVAVKTKVDPQNFFRDEQSIPPWQARYCSIPNK